MVHPGSLKGSLFSAVFWGPLRSGKLKGAHPANLENLLIHIKQLSQQLPVPTGEALGASSLSICLRLRLPYCTI